MACVFKIAWRSLCCSRGSSTCQTDVSYQMQKLAHLHWPNVSIRNLASIMLTRAFGRDGWKLGFITVTRTTFRCRSFPSLVRPSGEFQADLTVQEEAVTMSCVFVLFKEVVELLKQTCKKKTEHVKK